MSAPLRAISAAFRRKLLAQPGITRLPVCPACAKEREPRSFAKSGICQECESERALEYEIRMNAEFWPDGAPRVEHPVDDAFDSNQPFLVEDEGEEGPF